MLECPCISPVIGPPAPITIPPEEWAEAATGAITFPAVAVSATAANYMEAFILGVSPLLDDMGPG